MKKKISIALAAFAFALLLVVGSVAGTIAYLTSETEVVKNTFTVGDITITLDETDVDDSTADKDRDIVNTYKLLPGENYTKDPTIHVESGSSECYLFVNIVNNIESVEDPTNNIASQLNANGWVLISNGVYYYNQKVDASTAAKDVVVFEKIYIDADATNADLEAVAGNTVEVTAYAVQTSGFDTAVDAWNATFGA